MVRGVRFSVALVLAATILPAESEAGGRTADDQTAGIQLVGGKPSSRFCKPGDVVGIWRLVKWTSDFQFKDPHAPFLLPYQLFQFSVDKAMKSAHSAKPFEGDPVRMFKAMPALVTYAFDRDGMLVVKAKGSAASETWHCVWMTEDRADERRQALLKKGDLVMTLVGSNGQALYARQMRR